MTPQQIEMTLGVIREFLETDDSCELNFGISQRDGLYTESIRVTRLSTLNKASGHDFRPDRPPKRAA